jgi:hypothetical protein
MSDTTIDTTSTDTSQEDTSTQQNEAGDEVKKLRAEAAKYRIAAKENAAKAKQFDELLESQKTEAQKAAERAELAEKQAAEAAGTLNRYQVALRHGLSESDIEDLNWSGTDEEIEKRVQRFKERQSKAIRPAGSVDQGPRGSAPAQNPRDAFAAVINQALGQ